MATVWPSMVCWMHDLDHWKLGKGSHPYVYLPVAVLEIGRVTKIPFELQQDLSPLNNTSASWPMKTARSPVPEM